MCAALGPVFLPAIEATQKDDEVCMCLTLFQCSASANLEGGGKDAGRGHFCSGTDRSEEGRVLGREGSYWFNCLAESFC